MHRRMGPNMEIWQTSRLSITMVPSREWKYAKLRAYQQAWYRVSTKAMVTSKGSHGYVDPKNVVHQLVQKPH